MNLWGNPASVVDAHRMAQAIAGTTPALLEGTGTTLLEVDDRHVGEMVSMPEASLSSDNWTGVQFARVDLLRCALRLLTAGEVRIPGQPRSGDVSLCPMSELGSVGPDRRDVWDGFQVTDAVTPYPFVENHDTEMRRWDCRCTMTGIWPR